MAKAGRNQPCHCGSGKKYKTCCLRNDEARDAERRSAEAHPTKPPRRRPTPDEEDDLDLLDERSNCVVDLIHEGRLDEAEAAAQKLLTRYPDLMDGNLRLAMVYEARYQADLAADHYRKAAACLGDGCEALREDLLRQAERLSQAEYGRPEIREGAHGAPLTLPDQDRAAEPRSGRSL